MKKIILFFIKIYQITFSPDYGFWKKRGIGCRFYPTCSDFAYQAIEKLGVFKGLLKIIKRISRCHPFSDGGYDPLI